MLASIVLYPLALGVALGMGSGAGDVVFAVLVGVPPLASIALGVWAGRSGNALGAMAAAFAAAWLALLVTFLAGANTIWSGESNVGPLALGAAMAIVVFAAVMAAMRRYTA